MKGVSSEVRGPVSQPPLSPLVNRGLYVPRFLGPVISSVTEQPFGDLESQLGPSVALAGVPGYALSRVLSPAVMSCLRGTSNPVDPEPVLLSRASAGGHVVHGSAGQPGQSPAGTGLCFRVTGRCEGGWVESSRADGAERSLQGRAAL